MSIRSSSLSLFSPFPLVQDLPQFEYSQRYRPEPNPRDALGKRDRLSPKEPLHSGQMMTQ
jgi:hypothetical protein